MLIKMTLTLMKKTMSLTVVHPADLVAVGVPRPMETLMGMMT
jgi:hypothetical protein